MSLYKCNIPNYNGLALYPNQSNCAKINEIIHSEHKDSRGSIEPENESLNPVSDAPNNHKIIIKEEVFVNDKMITLDDKTVFNALNVLRAKFNSRALKKREELIERRLEGISSNVQSNSEECKKREELIEKRLEDISNNVQSNSEASMKREELIEWRLEAISNNVQSKSDALMKQEEHINSRLEDMSNNMQSMNDALKKREELTEKRLEDLCKMMMQNLRLNK